MERTYTEMRAMGCECSVITYSSLISACEKAGNWRMALRAFDIMLGEKCRPNTVTFNSLITACAQGARPRPRPPPRGAAGRRGAASDMR